MGQDTYIPYRQIATKLGISHGDVVLLTSDILKLAIKARKEEKEFIADPFINSFFDEAGTNGTLMIPAYNFDLEDGDSFDLRKTEPMTGSLSIAAMNDKSFQRTQHPLHSFMVKGQDAGRLMEMKNRSSFGIDSPFAYLFEKDALMVFAGTTPGEAMTFTHYVEEREQVWYREYKNFRINYTNAAGKTELKTFKLFSKKPGWTMKLERLEKALPSGILNSFLFNGIPFYTIRCSDAYNFISRNIREDNASLIAGFSIKLYFRDILKTNLRRFNIFRTTYGKIRSAKRIR